MNSILAKRLNLFVTKLTLIIMITICSIIPFIAYPNIIMFITKHSVDFTYLKFIALTILAVLSFIIIIYNSVLSIKSKSKLNIKMTLFLFTILVAVSTYFSTDRDLSISGLPGQYTGLISYVSYFIFYTLVVNNFDNKKLRNFIFIILSSSSLMALLCLFEYYNYQWYSILVPVMSSYTTQVHATLSNSNSVGSYFSLMAPLAIIMFVNSKYKIESIIMALFAMTNIVGLIVSTSRISWISVFISIVICILLNKELILFKMRTISIVIFILFAALVLDLSGGNMIKNKIINFKNQVESVSESNIESFGSFRIYIYKKVLSLTFYEPKHLLLGVGPDCLSLFHYIPSEGEEENQKMSRYVITRAHSDIFEYLSTMGILALICYLCFIFSILLPSYEKINAASPEIKGIFAAWLGYLIQSLCNVHCLPIVAIFFVFSAIIDNYYQQDSSLCLEKDY